MASNRMDAGQMLFKESEMDFSLTQSSSSFRSLSCESAHPIMVVGVVLLKSAVSVPEWVAQPTPNLRTRC